MNIGIDIKAFKNGKTGIARYLRTIMDHLQEIDRNNNYYLFECIPSDYAITNPRWKKIVLPWKLPGIFWLQLLLPRKLKEYGIDLFWAAEQISPLFYAGTTVTTVYDLTALRFPATCQYSNRLIQKYLFPATITRSTVLLPISDFVGNELHHFYPERSADKQITTISCGSPPWECREGSRSAPSTEDQYLFFAGNTEPRKNLLRLIDALEIMRRRGTTVSLHIAGPPGWKNSDFHRKLETSTVKDQIRFLGYLSEEELKNQYAGSSAVIYPSLYEGFGLPVLEALCMGTRIVTSQGTVMEEIAGDAADYFDPFDSTSIAETILTVLSKPHPSEEYSRAARRVLSLYSWRKSAEKLLEVFTDCSPTAIR